VVWKNISGEEGGFRKERQMRWLDELQHPEHKCKRIGHDIVEICHSLLCDPRWWEKQGRFTFRDVVVRVRRTKKVCRRCKEIIGAPEYKWLCGYQSFSASRDMWDTIRENGFYVE